MPMEKLKECQASVAFFVDSGVSNCACVVAVVVAVAVTIVVVVVAVES